MQVVKPPRWTFVRFPRGSMSGEPANRDKQRHVLLDALTAFTTIREPGGHVELAYRWEAPPAIYRGTGLREGPNA